MAQRKDGFRFVAALFGEAPHDRGGRSRRASGSGRRSPRSSTTSCARRWCAVNRLTPTIVEVVVRAPIAAQQFQPGQFYRLQNFESSAPLVDGTRLAMEGIALTGAWVDQGARACSR